MPNYDDQGRYKRPYDEMFKKTWLPRWLGGISQKQADEMNENWNQAKYGDLYAKMDEFEGGMTDLFQQLAGIPGFEGSAGVLDFDRTNPLNFFAAMQPDLQDKFFGLDQGGPEDANLSNFTTSPSIIPIYQDGGEVELTPIQAEKGEIAVLGDMTISEVKAEDSHKNMDSDEITDILAAGSWVFSNSVKIKKSDADVLFGYSQPLYEEVPNDTKVKEINFNDLYEEGEEELSTLELALRIKDKFPVNDQEEGNLLTNAANIENRISRQPYLEVLKALTELHTGDNPLDLQAFEKGGKVKSKKELQKFKKPGKVDGELGLNPLGVFKVIFDVFNTINQQSNAGKLEQKNLAQLEELSFARQQNLDNSTMATLASIVGQDPRVMSPDSTAAIRTYMQQFDRTPQYLRDQAAGRIDRTFGTAATQVFENAPNFQTAAANLGGLYAQAQAQQADLAASTNAQDVTMRNNFIRGLSELRYQDAANAAQAQNQTVSNRNQLMSNLGSAASNYYNQRTANMVNDFTTQMAIQGQAEAARVAAGNAMSQNLTNLTALSYRPISNNSGSTASTNQQAFKPIENPFTNTKPSQSIANSIKLGPAQGTPPPPPGSVNYNYPPYQQPWQIVLGDGF